MLNRCKAGGRGPNRGQAQALSTAQPGAGWRRSRQLLLAFALLACNHCSSAPRPSVVLIVVDTLRADRLGVYGNPRGLTPFLDSLASRGTVFQYAYAPSSWTVPSVASLFTSRYPSQHRATTLNAKLVASEITLGETLAAAGYRTAGVTANFRLTQDLGFGQGFQRWQALLNKEGEGVKIRGDELRRESLSAFDKLAPTDAPLFLYLQYMEPHPPYDPPPDQRARFQIPGVDEARAQALNRKVLTGPFKELTVDDAAVLASRYDGEVAAVDAEIRELFAALESRGLLTNAIIVITADHGEEFGEHGAFTHGQTLFEPVVRVPLIVIAPGYRGGQVSNETASLIDVAPTILALAGLPNEKRYEGRSLVSLMVPDRGSPSPNAAAPRDLLCELPPTGAAKGDVRQHDAALLRGRFKLVMSRWYGPRIFNLEGDADEKWPDAKGENPLWTPMQDALRSMRADLATRANADIETAPLDDATRERLRGLGYHD